MMLRHQWGRTSLTWLLCWTSTKQGHFEPLSWHCAVGRRWSVTAGCTTTVVSTRSARCRTCGHPPPPTSCRARKGCWARRPRPWRIDCGEYFAPLQCNTPYHGGALSTNTNLNASDCMTAPRLHARNCSPAVHLQLILHASTQLACQRLHACSEAAMIALVHSDGMPSIACEHCNNSSERMPASSRLHSSIACQQLLQAQIASEHSDCMPAIATMGGY